MQNWEEENRKNYTVSHPRRLSSEVSYCGVLKSRMFVNALIEPKSHHDDS